jgi:hypothetical protein
MMINWKNYEIKQQKIKELKLHNIDDIFYFISKFPSNSETALHHLKMSNYNTKWTYKAKFEVTLQFHCSNSKIEFTIEVPCKNLRKMSINSTIF